MRRPRIKNGSVYLPAEYAVNPSVIAAPSTSVIVCVLNFHALLYLH